MRAEVIADPNQLTVWWCEGCQRVFLKNGDTWDRALRHTPRPVNGRLPEGWCNGPAAIVDRPDVVAAYLIGGAQAVNAFNNDPQLPTIRDF